MVKVNSFLYLQCGKWIHIRCAGVKMVTQSFQEILSAGIVNRSGLAVEQEKKICCDVETVRYFSYLHDKLSTAQVKEVRLL